MKKLNVLLVVILLSVTGNLMGQKVGKRFVEKKIGYKITALSPKTVEVIGYLEFLESNSEDDAEADLIDYANEVKIPETVEYKGVKYTVTGIADHTLGCALCHTVILPSTIKSIGEDNLACIDATDPAEIHLKKVYSNIKNPSKVKLGKFTLSDIVTLYVPKGTKKLYESTEVWKDCSNEIQEF